MTDSGDPIKEEAAKLDEIDTLKAEISRLEDELGAMRMGQGRPRSTFDDAGRSKVLIGILAIAVVLMIPPTYLTTRRIYRWWLS